MAVEYRINLRRIGHGLEEGDLVLVGLDGYRWMGKQQVRNTAVARVVKGGKETVEIEVPELGIVKGQRPGYGTASLDLRHPVKELELYAVSKLRIDDPEVAYEYLDRLSAEYPFKSTVLHVTSAVDTGVSGRLIGENGLVEGIHPDTLTVIDAKPLNVTFARYGGADVTDAYPVKFDGFGGTGGSTKPVPELRAGDVVIARNFSFEFEDGKPHTHLVDVAVVGNFETTEDAVSFLGLETLPLTPSHSFAPKLASASQIEYELDAAHSRTEPDSALVLFYADGDEVKASMLGSSGHYAFFTDDLGSYFNDKGIEPGLWTINNLSIRGWRSHEGEYDSELSGDWGPATPEDIERLFGAAIDEEIAEIAEIDNEPGLADRYVQMAHQAVFDEKFDAEHKVFARYRMGVLGENQVPIEDVLNEDHMAAYIAAAMASIEPEGLRTQLIGTMKKEVLDRGHLFRQVVPTDDEAETFQARKTWRKARVPVVFVPDQSLARDMEAVVKAVSGSAHVLLKQVEGGADFSRSSIKVLMDKITKPLTSDNLRPFSKADNIHGEWFFVSKNKREVTLALFVEGSHVVSLVTSGEKSRLVSPHGIEITTTAGTLHTRSLPSGRYVSIDAIIKAADRAVGEIEARRELYGAYFDVPNDGIYQVHTTTVHIENGVIHRANGPAIFRAPRFDGDTDYTEYRFRGNLHRDDGPAQVEGDQAVWFRHGLEHRTDGPSSILGDDLEFRQFDRLHREGAPAVEGEGSTGWYKDGVPHREDGPALIYPTLTEYRRMGLLHRIGEPAVEHTDGTHSFYTSGRLHNLEGPAHVYSEGSIFAIDGEEMSFEEFSQRVGATKQSALAP
jgi:hypothetical protein